MPTPCSPVRQPPTSTQSFEDVLARRLGLFHLARLVGVEEHRADADCRRRHGRRWRRRARALRRSRRCASARRAAARSGSCRPCRCSRRRGPVAPKADLRPFQIAALSASDCDTLIVFGLERLGDGDDAARACRRSPPPIPRPRRSASPRRRADSRHGRRPRRS